MVQKNDSPAYVGKKPCGCIVAAIVDSPSDRERVAAALRGWVQAGLTVEHTTAADVRRNFVAEPCPHEPQQLALFAPENEEVCHAHPDYHRS